MKHITFEQYERISKGLFDYIDKRADAYEYLFKEINEREFGGKGKTEWDRKESYLRMSEIKALWDDSRDYKFILRFLIIKHYRGSIVEVSPNNKIHITEARFREYAIWLSRKISRERKEMEGVAVYGNVG